MKAPPIVERELREAARRPGTYRLRFLGALSVLLIWCYCVVQTGSNSARAGDPIMIALAVLALGFCMLAGVFLTSDALAEEKREGTIGLLFLTDLKPHDIVLGKLAARSINAFFGLLAIFPILGLTLLMGGVTGAEFGRLLLVLATTLFSSLCLGIAVSAASNDQRQAMLRTFLLIVWLAGVCPAFWFFQSLLWTSNAFDFLLLPSPGFACLKAFDSHYRAGGGSQYFWWSLGVVFLTGVAGLISATWVLSRSWREKVPTSTDGGWFSRALVALGEIETGPRRPRPALGNGDPAVWLMSRDPMARSSARKAFLVLLPLWLITLIASPALDTRTHRSEAFATCCFAALGLHLVIKAMVATEASRRLNEDRRSGALELLLVTPLSEDSILKGQRTALRAHFLEALVVLTVINLALLLMVAVFYERLFLRENDLAFWAVLFLGGVAALYTDFSALPWIGMWRGLAGRHHHLAVLGALAPVVGINWLLALLYFFSGHRPWFLGPIPAMLVWFGCGTLVDLAFAESARNRLYRDFRRVASGDNHPRRRLLNLRIIRPF